MTHDQEREKFEAWYRQEYSFSGKFGVFASGDYVSEHTHKKWHVWQEAWQAAKREPVPFGMIAPQDLTKIADKLEAVGAQAPMELTDDEWHKVWVAMSTVYHDPEHKNLANAARQWLAERRGG